MIQFQACFLDNFLQSPHDRAISTHKDDGEIIGAHLLQLIAPFFKRLFVYKVVNLHESRVAFCHLDRALSLSVYEFEGVVGSTQWVGEAEDLVEFLFPCLAGGS
jgi:hypothetical protein